MNNEFLLGILVADGSLTGDKKRPFVYIRMRDFNVDLLKNLQKEWGGKVYGPYSAGKSSMAKGKIYQIMWRCADLGPMLDIMNKSIKILKLSPHFYQKFKDWKEKYKMK